MLKSKLLGLCLLAILGVPPALAQDTDQSTSGAESSLEEITVTARRRDETLQEVPIQINVLTSEQLDQFGTTDFLDISTRIAGLNLNAGGAAGAGGAIGLRGISTSSNQAGFEQSVSVVVDGVQVSRPRVMHAALFDIQQIDIIRGPQALFFGKNTPAGAIDIRTADPGEEFSGFVTTSYEFEHDEVKVIGAVGGPVNDKLGIRVAGIFSDMEGYTRNNYSDPSDPLTDAEYPFNEDPPGPFGADPGIPTPGAEWAGVESMALRGTLEYEASDRFSANLKVSYSEYEDGGPNSNFEIFHCGTTDPDHVVRGAVNTRGDCVANQVSSRSDQIPEVLDGWKHAAQRHYGKADQMLTSLTMDFGLTDDLTLTSVTGLYDLDTALSDNFDYSTFNQLSAAEANEYEQFSQEVRLASNYDGSFNFLLGGYYQDASLDYITSGKIFPFGPDPVTGRYFSYERPGTTDTTALSAFGQIIFDVSDTIEIAAGVRFTNEERNSTMGHTEIHAVLGALGAAPVGVVLEDKNEIDDTSPELTITWRPTENVSAYASYKEGYKSGGMALSTIMLGWSPPDDGTGNPVTGPALQDYIDNVYKDGFTFDPEFIEGFELGLKTQLLDDTLTVNIGAFFYDYTDLQLSQFNSESFTFVIDNAAEATVNGLEIDANWVPSDGVTIWGSLNYLDSTYDDYVAECYDLQTPETGCVTDPDSGVDVFQRAGDRLPRAPEWAATLGFDVERPLAGDKTLGFTLNAMFSSEYEPAAIGNPIVFQDDFWKVDAGVRLILSDRYRFSVYGRNLTDESVRTRVTDASGAALDTYGAAYARGRQFVAEFGVDF
jgi:outer membrane receptor protein involved in Fe transport